MKVRTAAAQVVGRVLRHQGSLSSLLPEAQMKVPERDRPLLQELCYGCLRWQPQLDLYLQRLLDKPLRAKDSDIQALLLLGLYQLIYTRIPDHAAIGDTVESARALKKPWATRLANGVLRRFQRERLALDEQLQSEPEFTSAHPRWLLDALGTAWPEQITTIIHANNTHPPLTLRLNPRFQRRDKYLATLAEASIEATATPFSPVGIQLAKPCDPTTLPLFNEGGISVQDEAAQLAAGLLELAPEQRVLDACCAPGGKTGHLLEVEPALAEVVALDADPRRLKRVEENLARLKVDAKILAGDATQPQTWWDGEPFDRILLDAPCSATGIIRRHPDIKYLRSPGEIAKLAQLQGQLLDSLWGLLKPGGVLLYATCSVIPRENREQIEAFLNRQTDATCDTLTGSWGQPEGAGRQLLPDPAGHDGFYYARLRKM
jgi:16S rRNA (cytosine967-C5)-methyltransferase